MASSDETPGLMPPGDGSVPPGKAMSMGQKMVDMGAQMMQSLKPIKQMSQHVCTFALYSHDLSRQIQTHHYITRLNQDFLQCAVYDSDDSNARLIGVEYIVSNKIFQTLPPEEQKLWHSHAYEIITGLWVHPGVPEMVQKSELQQLAPTYGKFWCTWQVNRGDRLPMGAPALMMSPQGVTMGRVKAELIGNRDKKYKVSSEELKQSRLDMVGQEDIKPHPNADYWVQAGKGFAIDVEQVEMKKQSPFP